MVNDMHPLVFFGLEFLITESTIPAHGGITVITLPTESSKAIRASSETIMQRSALVAVIVVVSPFLGGNRR